MAGLATILLFVSRNHPFTPKICQSDWHIFSKSLKSHIKPLLHPATRQSDTQMRLSTTPSLQLWGELQNSKRGACKSNRGCHSNSSSCAMPHTHWKRNASTAQPVPHQETKQTTPSLTHPNKPNRNTHSTPLRRQLPDFCPSGYNPPVSFLHFQSGRLLFSTTVAKLRSYSTARRRNTQTFKERTPYSCISGGSYQKERRTSKQIKGEAPSKIFILCDAPLTH